MDDFLATHQGYMHYFIPVLVDLRDEEEPTIKGKYFWCEIALSVVETILFPIIGLIMMVNPKYEQNFVLYNLEEIDRG